MKIEEIEKTILKGVKYVPNEGRYISASEAASDYLQLYLKRKHNIIDDEISQATLGSLTHLGLETLINEKIDNSNYTEISMNTIITDTNITATATLDYIDYAEGVVIDWKTGKLNTAKKLKEAIAKGDLSHQYVVQLSHQNYIIRKNRFTDPMKYYIGWFFKDAGLNYRTGKESKTFELMEIPINSPEEHEKFLQEKALILYDYVDNNIIPPECSETWPAKIGGRTVKSKCQFYCSYNKVCPYFKQDAVSATAVW